MDGIKNVEAIPYVAKDYEVCAALLNAFGSSIRSDEKDWKLMGDTMLARLEAKNGLAGIVSKIPRKSFISMTNLTLNPKISMNDLKKITQGTYQITQARSYCQMHLKENENQFKIEVCFDEECRKFCGSLLTSTHEPRLLLANMKSRFVSQKFHKAYVLIDLNGNGSEKIIAYCCTCKNGLRTIGCCSHVTSIIWYSYYIDIEKVKFPSPNLNNFFVNQDADHHSDSGDDSDSESE